MQLPIVLGTLDIPGIPENVSATRRFLGKLLGDHHPDTDVSKLLLSELVSNSIRHSRSGNGSSVSVVVREIGGALHIEVVDGGGPTTPCLCPRGELHESGRGMKLVDTMASRWGFTRNPGARSITWFELSNS